MTSIFSFVYGVHPLSRATHGALRAGLVLLAGLTALAGAAPAAAQDHHPQVATLVKNLDQPSGPDIRTVLSKNQDGLMQGFRTGSNRGGYELESIWLYVRDTHESRYMTIHAAVYRDAAMRHKVATLTRGQLNDYAHNEWKAGANTYLEPDTDYWFVLDCDSGCANDNWAQFGTTYHEGEDGGNEPGWSIHDRMRFRRPDEGWFRDNNEAMRIRVRGRPSPYRAYRTEIVSTPRDGRVYHYGEHIDVALTFNVAVYVPQSGSSIAIRVGDTSDGSNYRAAAYHSGSGTDRLVYRYQVQLGDADVDGISVDTGGPNSGFGGTVPTIVASFGLLPVHDYYPGLADDSRHRVSGEFHVHDVAVTSTPAHEDGYRVGEEIEVTVKFSIEAYATGASVLAIRVGNPAPGNYRPAEYVSGSGTDRLTYRYRVQLDDYDADGISVDAGGPPSGFGGTLPTTSPELGSVPVSRDFSRVPDDPGQKVDGSFRVTGVALTSQPERGDTYRTGEEIEVTMNFSADAYTADSVVAIRVGDSAPDNYRPARYVSGSGTDKLAYRYRVVSTDYDSDGVSVDVGGPPSGFGERLPTTSPELGSVPVDRNYPGIPDHAGHKVDGAVTVLLGARVYVISEGGPAVPVTVLLSSDPAGEVVIPITAAPGGGATDADYTVAPTVLTFAPGETRSTVTVAAVDDSEVDAGESVRLGFGTLPAGVRHGHQLTVFVIEDNDGFDPIVDITDVAGGAEPGSVGFTVTIGEPSDVDITVDWGITDSAADPGDGYVASGTVTIPAGETTATVTVSVGEDAIGDPDRTFSVTLSNPVNAEFSAGADTIAAQLAVQEGSTADPSAPVVAAVPDTAGNLIVSWQPPDDGSARGYEVQYRVRGTEEWEQRAAGPTETQVPILFLEQDTEYEARVRSFHDDGGGRTYAPWSEPGYGRTGTHQEGSEPVVTLVLAGDDPAIEGEPVLLQLVVSELRNSYQWHGHSSGISVGLQYGWRSGGNVLPVSSQFGIVPRVFTVDHGLGGHREYRVHLWDYVADHGPLTITLQPGDGYRVGDADSVCVSIADSETLEATPCPDGEDSVEPDSQTGAGSVSLAVQDARATEGVDETIAFEVTLTAAASEPVIVDWSTADGTATAGQDYVASSGTLTFTAGQTKHTIEVTVLDDAHDEGSEAFELRLSNAVGAELGDAEAMGTIVNSDPMPRAWLGRFGRTAWEHTLDAVEQRLRAARTPATRAAVGGREIAAAGTDQVVGRKENAALAAWTYHGDGGRLMEAVSGQELLSGSEFQVATPASNGGGMLTVWGRGAYGHFAGEEGDLALNGDVASGTLGVDYASGPWITGLALSHSSGWGSYSQPGTTGGEVTSWLTGAYPYLGVQVVPERLSLWVAGGYGIGGLQLVRAEETALETGIDLLAGAAGLRGTLVPEAASGGFSLGVNADGLLLRATSDAAPGMAATTADVNRIRLGVEGSYAVALGDGARLTPSVEVGVRRDDGAAETGIGMDLGGGLRYTHPGLGLSLGLSGRALVLHETADLAEWGASGWLAWDPNPTSELGAALTVTPSIGATAGGAAAQLWSRETLAGLNRDPAAATGTGRVDARFGYGMPLAGGVGVPWAGIGLSERERDYRLGYALHLGDPSATDMRIELAAARREPAAADPEHTLSVRSAVSW